MMFITLKDWSLRNPKTDSAQKIAARLFPAMLGIKEAFVVPFLMPPIMELGTASGFEMKLLDEGNLGHTALINARNELLFKASQNPLLSGVRPSGLDDEPQYMLDINYKKANALGVEMPEIASTISIAFASSYLGDFIHKDRMKRIIMQGEAKYRTTQEDIFKWFVKNKYAEMVPLESFVKGKWTYGSPLLERFNSLSSITIQGSGANGVSSGVAMDEIEKIANTLPKGITFAWSGLSYEEKISIILIVPFGVFGAAFFSTLRGMANDVYFQIALLTTVGLSAKNAILIVEFARDLYREGHSLLEANMIAIKQRFRPIIMTSLAFMLGVSPLVIATGAGAESQNAIGVAVLGGMIFSTFISTFFVPLAYMLFETKR
jgi:multidrug efflux pump